jgi:DNA-directed RNA polymerase alpha subunit
LKVKISFEIDGSDSLQLIDAATKLAQLVQSVKPDDILANLDKVAVVLGFLPDDVTKSDADEQQQGRESPIKRGFIRPGDISAEALNRLNEVGIETLVELADYSEAQLWRFSHLRESDIVEYKALLARHDLALRGDEA